MPGYYLSMVSLVHAQAKSPSRTRYGNPCRSGMRFPRNMIEKGRRHESPTRSRIPEGVNVVSNEQHQFYPVEGRHQASRTTSIAGTGLR